MKFTKENVSKLFSEHDKYICFSLDDLQDDILKLDDTPEKVVVRGFGYYFERANDEKISFESELGKWMLENTFLAIDAVLNGYTIEKEQLYYIPLPELQTSDGIQQVLSQRKGDKNYFASRPTETLKQRYTKDEIAQVPEIYKPFAKPIEEEEE